MEVDRGCEGKIVVDKELDIVTLFQPQLGAWELAIDENHLSWSTRRTMPVFPCQIGLESNRAVRGNRQDSGLGPLGKSQRYQ